MGICVVFQIAKFKFLKVVVCKIKFKVEGIPKLGA
jgi:hypothetical protein